MIKYHEKNIYFGKEPELVFVYGTLRSGKSNHGYLKGGNFIGLARTRDFFALYLGRLPYAVLEQAISPLFGEVYGVSAEGLARIDSLAGHPDWFFRKKVPLIPDEGVPVMGWVYFFPKPLGRLLPTGDFGPFDSEILNMPGGRASPADPQGGSIL